MTYQLLVSTMEQKDFSLVRKMNIDSDAIIVNQHDSVRYEKVQENNHIIEMYTFDERGVGLSRNSSLMRATADIIEFADDDMVFCEGYRKIVVDQFKKHPEADAILFNLNVIGSTRSMHNIKRFKRIGRIEGRKYGCARLAVRRSSLLYHNISFSLLFGGGATYGAGEDTLLIHDILKAGMKVYVSPIVIADVYQFTSSWFTGYNEKFYSDKGSLMCAMYPKVCWITAVVFSLKHSKLNLPKFKEYFGYYSKGIRNFQQAKKRTEKSERV